MPLQKARMEKVKVTAKAELQNLPRKTVSSHPVNPTL
jgi:hypothetical protein